MKREQEIKTTINYLTKQGLKDQKPSLVLKK